MENVPQDGLICIKENNSIYANFKYGMYNFFPCGGQCSNAASCASLS